MSNQITVETLSNLAQQRTLSDVFEKAWMSRTGANPIALAISMVEVQRIRVHRLQIALFASVLMIFSWGFGTPAFKELLSQSHVEWSSPLMLSTSGLFLEAVGTFVAALVLMALEPSTPAACEKVVNDFLADLNVLYGCMPSGWDYASVISSRYEEGAKCAAHEHLVQVAREQIEFGDQVGKSLTDAVSLLTLGQMKINFVNKYETFARLGLASGGYDKYFREAKRQIKAGKAEALRSGT